jgi:hypothetical protein
MQARLINKVPCDDKEQGVTCASLRSTLPGLTSFAPVARAGALEQQSRVESQCEAIRTHCVSTRLNDTELAALMADAQAQHKKLGALLRQTYFDSTRPTVPPVNVEKWEALGEVLTVLTGLVGGVNAGQLSEDLRPVLGELLQEIHVLRASLIDQDRATRKEAGA